MDGKKIHLKWIRSGIGFSWRQKEMVRSLGLRRLHQVVERPDTPQIRGLVARIAHLVEIVDRPPQRQHSSLPEYSILAAEPASVPASGQTAQIAEETSAPGSGETRPAADD